MQESAQKSQLFISDALCQMEADGIITPEQSMTYLREYGELTYGFDQEYLERILRNYIGL